MNLRLPGAFGVLAGWLGDGPWRSKSVLAALAIVVVGTGFWCLRLRNSPPPEAQTSVQATNTEAGKPEKMPPNATGAEARTRWDWGRPFPVYVRVCASYVAGFCIGWFFRRVIRLALVVVALGVALLALGRFAGCDTRPAQERVKRGGEWVQHEAASTRDYLRHLLPSATGGGIGTFLGFRRRGKAAAPKPEN